MVLGSRVSIDDQATNPNKTRKKEKEWTQREKELLSVRESHRALKLTVADHKREIERLSEHERVIVLYRAKVVDLEKNMEILKEEVADTEQRLNHKYQHLRCLVDVQQQTIDSLQAHSRRACNENYSSYYS